VRRDPPQPPPRPLPGRPSLETEEGARTALITRIIIVVTVVLGQLWALTVALEAHLSDHTSQAWWLALFSIVSFVVVAALVFLEPAPRSRPRGLRGSAPVGGDRSKGRR
jgi:cytochrome bd-type quinol oxidase subunit 2